MKSTTTILLIMATAVSIISYFSGPDDNSDGIVPFIFAAIFVEVALLFIYFYTFRTSPNRRTLGIVLGVWSCVFILAVLAFAYLTALGHAYKN